MKNLSQFVIMKHNARKAGLHFDFRFEDPNSNMWVSFAVPKGISRKHGKKVLAIKTTNHTRKEALLTGYIKDGYGAGQLRKWDGGNCTILKYSRSHISIRFNGKRIFGIYHFISTVKAGDKNKNSYFLFKSETLNEATGMISRIPSCGEIEDTEEDAGELSGDKLAWDKGS
jgi:DNA ligase D-like protein (predicted 3'-phosphoesterase)